MARLGISASPRSNIDYSSATLLSGSASTSSAAGFIGGGQIGYDWQVSFKEIGFVIGVEADIQGIAASRGKSEPLACVTLC